MNMPLVTLNGNRLWLGCFTKIGLHWTNYVKDPSVGLRTLIRCPTDCPEMTFFILRISLCCLIKNIKIFIIPFIISCTQMINSITLDIT